MSQQDEASLPASHGRFRVDPFRFAAENRVAQGELPLAGLSRLGDVLFASEGGLRWKLSGFTVQAVEAVGGGAAAEPRLELEVGGQLELCCQRCLGSLEWPVVIHSLLHPVRAGEVIADEELEDDEVDAFEVDGDLDVPSLIEDEVLLALPISPRHENCTPSSAGETSTEESPFAALASLRSSGQAR